MCILLGGPDRQIIDDDGNLWEFEDHPYCGPIALDSRGEIAEKEPGPRSVYWRVVQLWYDQGKRRHGSVCVWETPIIPHMRHLCGNQYEDVADDEYGPFPRKGDRH